MSRSQCLSIGQRWIGDDQSCFVVAEIGAEPDLETARALIRAAASAGADAVKVQTFLAETLALEDSYFALEDGRRLSQYEYFKKRELSLDSHRALRREAEALGIEFFSTPSHVNDVALLEQVGVPAYKVGSDDLTNIPLLRTIAGRGKPVILSTGMAELSDVERAVAVVRGAGSDAIVLLHCVVGYPAQPPDANLRAITTLRAAFGVPVGFSDHLRTATGDIVAVAMGAAMIEKHLTLRRTPGDPDSDVACLPDEFAAMVAAVREAETMLGDGIKVVRPVEEKWRAAARKSLVAARDLEVGDTVTVDCVDVRRPADGIPAWAYDAVLGRRVRRRIPKGALLHWDAL